LFGADDDPTICHVRHEGMSHFDVYTYRRPSAWDRVGQDEPLDQPYRLVVFASCTTWESALAAYRLLLG